MDGPQPRLHGRKRPAPPAERLQERPPLQVVTAGKGKACGAGGLEEEQQQQHDGMRANHLAAVAVPATLAHEDRTLPHPAQATLSEGPSSLLPACAKEQGRAHDRPPRLFDKFHRWHSSPILS